MDTAAHIAQNPAASADERFQAQAEMQKSVMPRVLSDLIPAPELQPIIDYISNGYDDQHMSKSLAYNTADFPSKNAQGNKRGMQSVLLDDLQISVMGEWFEKPSAFGFDMMRQMVDQTPILSAVIATRIRQIERFCRPQESGKGPGFAIRLKDKDAEVTGEHKKSIILLQEFFQNSGWEQKPRQRMRLKRDDFASFMKKLTRDTLTMDSMAIETEWKRDKNLGLDGLYAVDGSTIRLVSEEGYRGEDEIFALQVVQGRIRSAYSYDDLIYVPRNPRADVLSAGYGFSETELLIKVVTGLLNAFTYNNKYFDSNQIPKGLLQLTGNYSEADMGAFRRYWSSMVRGVNNAHQLPFLVSKDQESKAEFTQFGQPVDEMMFSKWMTFLTSIICAVYGIGPDEINFDAFSAASSSPLSGSDTEQRLAHSKENGLRPLMTYFENLFSDFVVSEFSPDFVFRWTGLDDEDEAQRYETRKLVMTVNELRAHDGLDKIKDAWGEAPLNPALLGVWQQSQQQAGEDYGTPPDDGGAPGEPGGSDAPGVPGEPEEFSADDADAQQPKQPQQAQQPQQPEDDEVNPEDDEEPITKALPLDGFGFGLPVLRIEP